MRQACLGDHAAKAVLQAHQLVQPLFECARELHSGEGGKQAANASA